MRRPAIAIILVVLSFVQFVNSDLAGATARNRDRPHRSSSRSVTPALEETTYLFVQDSSGPGLQTGAQITLGFEPKGVAYLYAVQTSSSGISTLSYHGTWSYGSGKLSLAFSASDFKFSKTFTLSLTSPTVSMPFQVLTTAGGTSRWRLENLPIDEAIFSVFDSSLADPSLGLNQASAGRVAGTFATSWIGHDSNLAGTSAALVRPEYEPHQGSCAPSLVTSVGIDLGTIVINTNCAAPLEVMLQQDPNSSPVPSLEAGQLATDPRVFLDAVPDDGGANDPSSKTAIVIAPFATNTTGDTKSDQSNDAHILGSTYVSGKLSNAILGGSTLARWKSEITADGYSTPNVLQNDVTVPKLVAAFTKDPSPGIVIWDGHGNGIGALLTDEDADCGNVANFQLPNETIAGHNYSNTIACGVVNPDANPVDRLSGLVVLPSFWTALEDHVHVSFKKSLVVIGACSTDASAAGNSPRDGQTPLPQSPGALASAFDAGAYFAFSAAMAPRTIAATVTYIVDASARKTHTAEETFYNILRVAKSGQMIYKEDADLNGAISAPPDPTLSGNTGSTDLYDYLDAYGWNGHSLISYWGNGMDGPQTASFNTGQIWWLMFAARWSHDINVGVSNLASCAQYWNAGQLGGLKSVFCQNANTGTPPSTEEVDYATYLLVNRPVLSGAVPRWTMNDATP